MHGKERERTGKNGKERERSRKETRRIKENLEDKGLFFHQKCRTLL